MKTNNIYLLLLASFLLFSCKKEEDKVCRISQVVYDNNSSKQTTFKYDESGRPTEIISTYDNIKYKFTYTGLTGKLDFLDINTNVVFLTADLTFDASNRLKSFEEFHVIGSDIYRYFYQFEYNAEGYLFRNIQTLTGGGYNDYYCDSLIYDNGNVVKDYSKFRNGTLNYTTDFIYAADINTQWNYFFSLYSAGEPFSILSGYYFLEPLLGKPTKSLPTKITTTGTLLEINDFTYTLNAAKQVTGYTQIRNYNSSIYTYNFNLSYSCN